ncbi:hypothetical protein ASPCAL10119 [Aspergillus calidoustus]|uniref:Rhodopsin domain-containing protein n=1 Tax=Aspergillus calidoustus TaxID=454130 RepID=A0A0U5G946_ASPCI|nr:hypothetical protein ASPCAL10119 [Aspergillus calidoustus]
MRLPSDIRAPLTADNVDDHSGLVVVITSFYIVLTLSSLAARLFSSHRKQVVQRDDYAFAALVILAFAQASVVLAQVHYGWGRQIDFIPAGYLDRMLKTGYAADILSIATLALSKIVTCIFYESLFYQMQRRFIRSILILTVTWTIMSILLLAIRCDARPWTDISSEQCSGLFRRWQAITALDVVTEVSLLVYSAMAMSQVKVSLHKKLLVILALGCRIVLVPLSALRLHYTNLQLTSDSPTLLGAYATTAAEIYLSLSIICQITSSLKFIIAVYEDKDGISYTDGSRQSHSGYRSKSGLSTDLSSQSHNARAYTTRRASRPIDIDGEGLDDLEALAGTRTGGSACGAGALKIFRTMQFKVQDEAIELDDRGREVEGTGAGIPPLG